LSFLFALSLLAPFFVPYFSNVRERNADYAQNLLGFGDSFANRTDFFQFNLYLEEYTSN